MSVISVVRVFAADGGEGKMPNRVAQAYADCLMYLRYFGFQEYPFSITPDPAFLYLSSHHREALSHLLYGTGEHGGFVQLTGEVGTGKTTLIRALLEQDQPDLDVALCLNPQLTVVEFIATICDDLGVSYPKSRKLTSKDLVDRLNAHLLDTHTAGRRTVLIVDEAQNLGRDVLEQVRLLTNLETHKNKLLRIILVGQPELEKMLSRTDLRQLAQRITARYHLLPLDRRETRRYIHHRLERAGASSLLFTEAACAALYLYSRGIPRLVNTIGERALMGAYARGRRNVGWSVVRHAAREVLPRTIHRYTQRLHQRFVPLFVLAVIAVFVVLGLQIGLIAPETANSKSVGLPAAVTKVAQPDPPPVVASPDAESNEDAAVPAGTASGATYNLPQQSVGMSRLLRLWGVFGAKAGVRCRSMHMGDLYCLHGHTNFAQLERFDRPALLELQKGGQQRQVLLVHLDQHSAKLVFPRQTVVWPRSALASVWNGKYKLVWRLQSSTRQIGSGSIGNAVVWLRRRLMLASGADPDAYVGRPSSIFDDQLESDLRRFQITHGLKPDGLAGPRTMIMLNNLALPAATPTLRSVEQG